LADNRPMALSVEKVRHEMLRGLLIPREMVNKAIQRTYEQLDANETKFFSYKGEVTETRVVEDTAARGAAADKIFSLAGLYVRDNESKNSTPGVAMEVDPRTGVMRIIVGDVSPTNVLDLPEIKELPPVTPSPAEAPVGNHAPDVVPPPKVGVRRTAVSPGVWRMLSDEIVD
jgi:hypothetical protein